MSTKLTQVQDSENHIKLEPANPVLASIDEQVKSLAHEMETMRKHFDSISIEKVAITRAQAKLEAIKAIIEM